MLEHLKSKGCTIGGVTLGEKGLVWYDETGQGRHHQALPVPSAKVIDTNGAGDMFAGTLLVGITHVQPPPEPAALANRTAAAVVSQHGNRLSAAQMQQIHVEFQKT
jgi:sugar/nucleoside kinase (ribokinase family)